MRYLPNSDADRAAMVEALRAKAAQVSTVA